MNKDQNYANFTSAVFKNLFWSIERPYKLFPRVFSKIEKKRWRKKVITWLLEVHIWADEETLWFGSYEEFLDYNPDKLRQRIKEKALEKIQIIKKEGKNARLSATNKKK